MKPANRREWGYLAAGAAAGLLVAVLLAGRYEVVPSGYGAVAFRLDRWTGSLERCGLRCIETTEDDGFAPVTGATGPATQSIP